MYKSGDEIGGTFPIVDPSTGGLTAADSEPEGTLVLNGVDSEAVVTVEATATTGRYKWSVTLPAGIADGDSLAVWIAAAVGEVAGGNNVWHGVGCSVRPSDLVLPAGPYPCTWTVEHLGSPLQSAVVAFYLGSTLKGRGTTDESGEVEMSLDAGVYTVAIVREGYVHTPESYTVAADEATHSHTFDALTPVGTVPEPSESGQCTGYGYTYDADGVLSPVTGICCRLVAAPDGSGVIVSDTVRTETSDVSALVSFAGLWIGAQYRFWVSGSDKQHTITISEADVDEDGLFPLPNFYG